MGLALSQGPGKKFRAGLLFPDDFFLFLPGLGPALPFPSGSGLELQKPGALSASEGNRVFPGQDQTLPQGCLPVQPQGTFLPERTAASFCENFFAKIQTPWTQSAPTAFFPLPFPQQRVLYNGSHMGMSGRQNPRPEACPWERGYRFLKCSTPLVFPSFQLQAGATPVQPFFSGGERQMHRKRTCSFAKFLCLTHGSARFRGDVFHSTQFP